MKIINILLQELTKRPKSVASYKVSIIFLVISILLMSIPLLFFFDKMDIAPLSHLMFFAGVALLFFNVHNWLFMLYRGNNKVINFAINLFLIFPGIFFAFVYIGAYIGRPLIALIMTFVVTGLVILIPLVNIFNLLTLEAGLFVTICASTIVTTYFGESITKFYIKHTAGYGATDEEIEHEAKVTTAVFNKNLYTFTVYLMYFVAVVGFSVASLNGFAKDESFLLFKDLTINSFAVYICFERLIKNSNLVRITNLIKKE